MLEQIQKENDIKKIDIDKMDELAEEIRSFLISSTSQMGGHLASNLGVVELTIAMHREFDLPKDRIIWDVGHQAYTHKILTGRKEEFSKLRTFHGMSGFPKRRESDCDAFDTGHSSTSISAGVGYVRARELKGEDHSVVAVIGDGSMTGGMAYEALNNAATLETNFIIVLNDNHMSISENVGGMSKYLDRLRTADIYTGLKKGVMNTLHRVPFVGESMIDHIRKTKSSIKQLFVPGMFFEDMGITYLGPVPGHNVSMLCQAFREAKKVDGPVLLHVMTKKGNGYAPAENAPNKFHGVSPFDIETGEPRNKSKADTYTEVFGKVLCDEAKKNKDIVAITAAMSDGTGLSSFEKRFPERFFDVGIAEAHAVTFAGGLALGGMKPVFAVYSSFLQRGYDQIVHDIALQNLPVVFAIDRAGLVGNDGETHQGIFDISYLSHIPNMTIMAPKHKWELADMLRFALQHDGPIALRYPRGVAYAECESYRAPIVLGKSEQIFAESEIAIFSVGHMFEEAIKVHENMKQNGYACSLYNARFVCPIDEDAIVEAAKKHKILAVIEENVNHGGYAQMVMEIVIKHRLQVEVVPCNIPDCFVEQGSIRELREEIGLDAASITKKIIQLYEEITK